MYESMFSRGADITHTSTSTSTSTSPSPLGSIVIII